MIKFERTKVYNIANAIYGARNPLNSWHLADSDMEKDIVGPSDMKLAKKLINAGDPSHRKFLRQIFVTVDITAPLYWWKEYDTYKVATVANSCSTMHKIHANEFTLDDFSHEHLDVRTIEVLKNIVDVLNDYRTLYVNYNANYFEVKGCPNKKDIWWQLIQLLPSSYNQKRTITMNYENIIAMVHQRKHHKLDEWRIGFIEWARTLPYAQEFIFFDETSSEEEVVVAKNATPNPIDEEIKVLWNSGMGKKRISQKCHVTTEYVAQVIGGK